MSTDHAPYAGTEVVIGSEIIHDGHTRDGYGFGIDPGAQYNVEYIRYTEVMCIWRVGLRKPEKK